MLIVNTCTSITGIQQQDTCIIRMFINNSVLGTDYKEMETKLYTRSVLC